MASNSYLGTKDIDEIFPELFNKKLPCIKNGYSNKKDKYKIENNGCAVTVKVKNGSVNINIINIYQ